MKIVFSYLTVMLAGLCLNAQSFSPAEMAAWKQQASAVSIVRDNWGIPHVYGKTDADAVFGLMYAQCEDDFWSVEDRWIYRLGRRSALSGERFLMEDLYTAIFTDTTKAIADYKKLPAYYQSILQGFSGALNYYIALHPEKVRLISRYEPWYALVKGGPSFSALGLSNEEVYSYLSKQVKDSSAVALTERSSVVNEAPRPMFTDIRNVSAGHYISKNAQPETYNGEPAENTDGIGSNGWALSPSRTTNGHAFLFINPHGVIAGPGQRLETHIASESGLNVYGAPFTGEFIMWQGFNEHFGWARTVQYADMNDIYALTFDKPSDPLQYRYDKGYQTAQERVISVLYKKGGAIAVKRFTILQTRFGPVIAIKDGKLLTLRDSTDETRYVIQSWDITRAKDLATFKKSWSVTVEKPCTLTYADDKGNIAYWHANMVPRRDKRYDWTAPVTEIGAATEWKGIHGVDEVPHVLNPSTGFIQNSNSSPWIISGKASPDSAAYPAYMSYDPRTLRSLLGLRLFNNTYRYSLDSFTHAAMGNRYLVRYELFIPSLLKQYAASDSLKDLLREPMAVLAGWDYRSDTGSVATTLAILLDDKLGPAYEKRLGAYSTYRQRYAFEYTTADSFPAGFALRSLLEVVRELEKDFGDWRIPWGRINRLQRVHPSGTREPYDDNKPSLAVGAVQNQAGSLFDFASKRFKNTKLRYGTKGNTFVAVVDMGPRIKAKTVLAYGQSADPASPHYLDQARIYADGELKDAYFYKEDVLQHAERTYHPGE